MSCVIVGCKSHSGRKEIVSENISFHRFPADVNWRQKWIDAIARRNWEWKKYHHICSRHFKDNSFINFENKWRRLKLNAVPSLHLRDNRYYTENRPALATATASTSEVNIPSASSSKQTSAPAPSSATSTNTSSAKLTTTVTSTSTLNPQELLVRVSDLEHKVEKLRRIAKRRLLKNNPIIDKY